MEDDRADLPEFTTIEKSLTTIATLSGLAWIATSSDQASHPAQELIENAFALIYEECEQVIESINRSNPQ